MAKAKDKESAAPGASENAGDEATLTLDQIKAKEAERDRINDELAHNAVRKEKVEKERAAAEEQAAWQRRQKELDSMIDKTVVDVMKKSKSPVAAGPLCEHVRVANGGLTVAHSRVLGRLEALAADGKIQRVAEAGQAHFTV